MRLVSYDCEVFAHDWLVTLKDKETGVYTCIWNDNEALKMALSDDCIYVGFNSKHYDQYIIKAIAAGFAPEEIKKVNDFIIAGGQGWQCPLLDGIYFRFSNVDIRDDTQQGLSLKAIEGHLGMSVKGSSVPFDIDRPLTPEEKAETEFYCKHDVDTAERLIDIRKDYLKNKINLGRLAGLDEVKAMGMTNAKLTAAMLKATKKPHDDERKYVYPDNLRKEYIPPEVFAFFDRMYDETIPDSELFKGKFNLTIGECPVTLGYGGIHGAIPNFFWEESEHRGIWNEDVGSYYPHLCTINGYTSRNIPSPQIYEDILDRRMKAKAAGDKHTANALKLVCNTTYGCLLNQYNDLYDPLMGRSVCISGQLYLLELAEHCYQEIEGLRIVQLNTDGIMVECDKKDYDTLTTICAEWQSRTGFDLEEDTVIKIAQKDVNNYVEVQPGGKAKAKGGYLVKGIAPAGAFNINNSCVIVATALKEFFVNGTPVEDTINSCDDIFQFQIIAKAGAKYREAYHVVDGEKRSVQKVNRVYATADERYGKIFKVKAEDDSEAKIDSLPEHCIIDNDNELSIDEVDRSFYIAMAKKRVDDFKGIKPEKTKKPRRTKKMATTTKTANVYQKLLTARAKFLEANVEKTSHKCVDNLMRVIETWHLTDYDKKEEIKMSNSPLVVYTNLSPNHSGQRTHSIDRITPHCVVGQLSAENICGCFISTSRQASCNYGIGTDGRISMSVEEKNRSWCSSSRENDQRAVTIECASDKTAPYAFNGAVYASLVNLCVDICQRNGKSKLLWLGDKNKTLAYAPKSDEMVLTVHRWFANKSCPGDWLYNRLGNLATEVTKRLTGGSTDTGKVDVPSDGKTLYRVQTGAFSKRSNADAWAAKLKAAGFNTYIVQMGNLYKVQVGAYSQKSNAENMMVKLKAVGYDAFITTKSGTAAGTAKKSAAEIAKEIYNGTCSDARWSSWGNGADRVNRLKQAGYDPSEVQSEVNKLF